MIDGLPARLLGSHVGRGAEDDALRRRGHAQRRRVSDVTTLGLQGFRETEVEHLDLAFRRDLDIGRLQIAMNNALLVCRFNRVCNLQRKPDGLGHSKRATLDHVGQRVALDQFENEEPHPGRDLQAVDRSDVRMIQRREDLGFPFKACQSIGIVGKLAGQRLDSHVAPEARIGRTPHLAHAAFSEKDTNLVAPESRTA